MRRKVKRNQWIANVLYNGDAILLIDGNEQKRYQEQKEENNNPPKTTVIICDGHYIEVGEMVDGNCIARCVMWHDPMMYWGEYHQYFNQAEVRVITCYLKTYRLSAKNSGLEESAEELSNYIQKKLEGNILLIGHSKGGLMMYETGCIMPATSKRQLSVMTISAPFAGTIMSSKEVFRVAPKRHFSWLLNKIQEFLCSEHQGDFDIVPNSCFLNSLCELPEYVNHIAFVSFANVKGFTKKGFTDYLLKILDNLCYIEGDGIVSGQSQIAWKRKPDMCLIAFTTHDSSLRMVLEDFAKYAGKELFFSEVHEFQELKELENVLAELDVLSR